MCLASLDPTPRFHEALDKYMNAFQFDVQKYADRIVTLTLPVVDSDLLMELFNRTQTLFMHEPTLMELRSPCVVVGDIHGQILDLIRILTTYGMPNRRKYVFLGDIVDRGEYSVETLIIVLLLKALWPDNVYVIRGNHEFEFLSSQCGFMTQIVDFYQDFGLYQAACNVFQYIPLAARIDKVMLCVHGGIGPELTDLHKIQRIMRPVCDFGDEVLDSLVWSDPSKTAEMFEPSARGTGYFFGQKACEDFLEKSQLKMIIRGHECVESGCQVHFDGKLVTVFSASNYCGLVNNKGGVLEIEAAEKWHVRQFPPLPWLQRKHVLFQFPGQKLQEKTVPLRHTLRPSASAKIQPLSDCEPLPKLSKMTQSVKELPRLICTGPGSVPIPGKFAPVQPIAPRKGVSGRRRSLA